MVQSKATNIFWHEGEIAKGDRERALRQKGVVLWFTGLSGSGKSTLAREVEKSLFKQGHVAYVLDGDNVRFGLNKNLGFSPADRQENIRRIGEVAKLFADAGLITLTAFISPYQQDRLLARELLPEGDFIEIYVACSLDECEARDVKGLYKKARAGEIKEFTGISAPYEAPDHPEVTVITDKEKISDCVAKIMDYLKQRGIIQNEI